METTFHDFTAVLCDIIDSRFPNTERYIAIGGDFVWDWIFELRENDKKYRFSPYELYSKSSNYEETIEEFVETWERML